MRKLPILWQLAFITVGYFAVPANAQLLTAFRDWQTAGDVKLDEKESLAGQPALRLTLAPEKTDITKATGPTFGVKPGVWEVTGALKTDLYVQDVSFNVAVTFDFLNATGKVVEARFVTVQTGVNPWRPYRTRIVVPENVNSAQLRIEINKTRGTVWATPPAVKFIGAAKSAGIESRIRFSTAQLGNLFYPEERPAVTMELETPAHRKLSATCELRDYWGDRQAAPWNVTLQETGKGKKAGWHRYEATIDLSGFPLKVGPYYELHAAVDLGDEQPAREQMSFAILPESSTFRYDALETPFGAHTWNATVKEYFPLSARLGLRRCLVFWNWPADPPYTPAFTSGYNFDCRLGWPKKYGMKPYGVLYPITNAEAGKSKHSAEALRAGIRQSIEMFKKDGLWGFQIGNEPPSWNPQMVAEDVRLYKLIYEEIKKTDSNMVAIGSAIGPNEAFFKAGFQPYQDAYNVHVYADLGVLRNAMKQYREFFAKYGGAKPIWSTEIGSMSQGLSRFEIANDIVRKVVCFFADGGEFFTWFATGGMPDPEGTRRGTYSDSMDLFDGYLNMHNPRLDAVAYFHIIDALCVKKFVKEVAYDNGASGFLFQDKQGECLQVLWNMKAQSDSFVPLPGVDQVQLTHYDGTGLRLDARGQGITLHIGEEPILLTYRAATVTIADKFGEPVIAIEALPKTLAQGESAELRFRGNVTLTGPPTWKITGTGSTYRVEVPADASARQASFRAVHEQGELYFRLPVAGRIAVDLLPIPSREPGKAGVEVVLRNNAREAQTVRWNAELLTEAPMNNGSYKLESATPATAYFTDVADGSATIPANSEQRIPLHIADVDRLTIYQARARAVDAAGKEVSRTRYLGGFTGVPKATVKLDGALDDAAWQRAPVLLIDEPRQYLKSAREMEGGWRGPTDLSGKLRLLWDEKYLYVGVEVVDDKFANNNQDQMVWSGDSLQFLINPCRDETGRKGRYDYYVGHGLKGDQAWCNLSADGRAPAGAAPDIIVTTKRMDDRTGNMTYEVAIPWTRLAPFEPGVGRNLGFSMIINEDDGLGRIGFIGWFGGVHLKEADHVGDLILEN